MAWGRLVLLAGAVLLTLSAGGVAEARRRPPVVYDMVTGQPAPPPYGYYEFCQREPADCFTPEQIQVAQREAELAAGRAAPPAATLSALSDPEIDTAAAGTPRANYWSFAFRNADAQRRVAYRGRAPLAGPPASIRKSSTLFGLDALPSRKLIANLATFPPDLDLDGRIVMTRDVWSTLNRINRGVNRQVISVSDKVNYGDLDVWALPISRNARGWGDCEDYAMEKRHQLLQAGYPMKLLSLALVRTRWGDSHAVLLVETNEGAYALDSFSNWLLPWWKVDYQWIMRQSLRDPSVWLPVLGEGWSGKAAPTPG